MNNNGDQGSSSSSSTGFSRGGKRPSRGRGNYHNNNNTSGSSHHHHSSQQQQNTYVPKPKKKQQVFVKVPSSSSVEEQEAKKQQESKIVNKNTINDEQVDADDELGAVVGDFIPTYINRFREILTTLYSNSQLNQDQLLNIANRIWSDVVEPTLLAELNPSLELLYTATRKNKLTNFIGDKDIRLVTVIMGIDKLITRIHHSSSIVEIVPEFILQQKGVKVEGDDRVIHLLPQLDALFFEILTYETRKIWRLSNSDMSISISNFEAEFNKSLTGCKISQFEKQIEELKMEIEQLKKTESAHTRMRNEIENEIENLKEKSLDLIDLIEEAEKEEKLNKRTMSSRSMSEDSDETTTEDEPMTPKSQPVIESPLPTIRATDQEKSTFLEKVSSLVKIAQAEETESSEKLKTYSTIASMIDASFNYHKDKSNQRQGIVPMSYSSIPTPIILFLLDFFKENPEKIPSSVTSKVLSIVSCSLKGRRFEEKNEIFTRYHTVLMHFTKYLTIRKMELFMNLMNKISTSLNNVDSEFVYSLLKQNAPSQYRNGNTLQGFSDRSNLVRLWQVQAFCATLVMSNPKLSNQIFTFYERHCLSWMNLWEEIKNVCLRETSLTAVKKKKPKTQQNVTGEVSTSEGEASSEKEEVAAVASEITEKVQNQVAVSESLESDLQNIETQLGKSPEVLKQEAEEHTMLQITRDCIKIFKEELEPSKEEREGKKELVEEISQVIQSLFSSNQNIGDQQVKPPKIYTYGSYASDLSLKGSSDIDMCVSFAGLENIQENSKIQGRLLEMIRKEMDGKSKKDTNTLFPHLKSQNQEVIRSSRVPILKIHDNKRNLDCDLCVATYLGVVNTRMISTYLQVDSKMLTYYKENGLATVADSEIDRIKTFIYMIKRWAKRRHINDPPGGSLSSYSYVLMCLQFLQHLEILPSLQQLAEDTSLGLTEEDFSKPQHVNAYNTKYLKNLDKLPTIWKAKNPQKVASYTLGHLLYLFFEFYAKKFDFDTSCISIRAGSPLPKKNAKTIISLEDPFEIRDLGCVVSNEMGPVIVSEFRRSHEILSAGGSINDLFEEREGVSSVNIYQMKREVGKQGYDDYLPTETVDEMLAKGELYQGELRVNKKRFTTEAYVTVEGFKKDVLIEGLKNRNRAMHGDVVAIKIQKTKVVAGSVMSNSQQESTKSPEDTEPTTEKVEAVSVEAIDESDDNVMVTGIVVSILKKKSPSIFPCTLMAQDDIRGYRWLLPLEKTFPKLNVPFEEFEKQFNAKSITLEEGIFVVEMKPWNKNSNFPKGSIIGCLGLKKDLWSLKRALLLQYCPIMFDNIFSERKVDRDTEKEITSATSSSVMNQSMAGSTAGKVVAKSGLESHADDVKLRSDYGQNQVANIGDTISDIKLESVSSDDAIQIQDWRESRRIFTIDPTESRDLDDAIAIEPIFDSNTQRSTDAYRKPYAGARKFLVTVAIADVSQFVPEGSAIDKEARKRGTSVYMVNSVEHMLDPSLSQNLCSLHGGVNRFAVAVEFVIDRETAAIEKSSIKFNRCMMRSACRLDYNRAQKMIVHYKNKYFHGQYDIDPRKKFGLEPEEVPAVYGKFTLDEIYEDVNIFNELSQKLRKQRADKGSIFLQNEQLRFECDMEGKGFPLKVNCDEHNESHILIEEMMLVANELAATALNDHFGDATLLRVHSSPKVEKWAVTVSLLADKIYKWKLDNITRSGIAVEAEKEKAHVLDKLEKCVKHVTKGAENNEKSITIQNIINLLIESTKNYPTLMHTIQHSLLREMQLAQYATVGDCKKGNATKKEVVVESTDFGSKRMVPKKQFENTWHFALCKEFYTHFTSPIRRYADLVVHRLLLQMIREKRLKEMNVSDESILSKRETSLSAQEISTIAEHLNDQAYRARLLQDECEKQYLAYYLWPRLSKSVERVEAVVLSMGKRSFTIFVPKYGLEIQVNAMKHFSPTPTTLKMDEIEMESLVSNNILKLGSQTGEDEDAPVIGGTIIEKLTITWSGASPLISVDEDDEHPSDSSAPVASQHNRSIELKPLKQVMVDLDINTSSVPLEIICYNIWEKDEKLVNNDFSKRTIEKNTKAVCSRNAHGSKQFTADSTTAVLKSSSEAQGKQMEKLIDNMQKINRRKKFENNNNNQQDNSSPPSSSSSNNNFNNNFERRGKPFARGGFVNSRGGGSRRQYHE